MANYKLHVYGWEVEMVGHSLTNEQVERIQELMKEKGYDELRECRWDLEDEGIVPDIYNPDLFYISRALDNGTVSFRVLDEDDNLIVEFEQKDLGDSYDLIGDDAVIKEKYPYEGHMAIPEDMDNVENILFICDESKGGVVELLFQSEEIPSPKDFCCLSGDVTTPEGVWDFISKYFYKGHLLEVYDHLDNTGKTATVKIYTKNNEILNLFR